MFPTALPATTYIIASTMRTGSYLLCEGLEATGVAGHPREFFCPERRENYAGDWHLPPDVALDEFLRVAIRKGTTENGVLGIKIHAHHLEPLAQECGVEGEPWKVLEKLFPAAKYIHLRRRDHRAQAISYYRAKITNEWYRIADVIDPDLTGRQPQFNAAKIHELEKELAAHQKLWNAFFAAQNVEVLEMEYEALATDYRGEVERALAFLGLDATKAKELPEPRLLLQRDETTERWRKLMDVHFPR
jgi:trehalose 2-sulfotransferase